VRVKVEEVRIEGGAFVRTLFLYHGDADGTIPTDPSVSDATNRQGLNAAPCVASVGATAFGGKR